MKRGSPGSENRGTPQESASGGAPRPRLAEMAARLSRENWVVALDGPAASGKSTAGRGLARLLGYLYINSGAMYRAAAQELARQGIPLEDERRVVAMVEALEIRLLPAGAGEEPRVLAGGREVTEEIGSAATGAAASAVSIIPGVRRRLVELQREAGREGRVVMDGRDIGTVVFPRADCKFFFQASLEVRARRRWRELRARGERIPLREVGRQLAARDRQDSTREDSPLVRAPDALLIDLGRLNRRQAVAALVRRMYGKLAARGDRGGRGTGGGG